MTLQNGYVMMYNAPERKTTEQPTTVFATKDFPKISDAMLVPYIAGTEDPIDLKTFKLIYSDGKHLLGSVTGVPASTDSNILIKTATTGELVFGYAEDPTEVVTKTDTDLDLEN